MADTKQPDDVDQVFKYWREKTNRAKAKLDVKRRKKIQQAFKLGFDVAALKRAVDGCVSSKFHMGDNPQKTRYDHINVIFRDAEHIENFIEKAQSDASVCDDMFCGAE